MEDRRGDTRGGTGGYRGNVGDKREGTLGEKRGSTQRGHKVDVGTQRAHKGDIDRVTDTYPTTPKWGHRTPKSWSLCHCPPRKQRHQPARGVGAAKNSNSSQGDPQNALYTLSIRYFPAIKPPATSLIFVH